MGVVSDVDVFSDIVFGEVGVVLMDSVEDMDVLVHFLVHSDWIVDELVGISGFVKSWRLSFITAIRIFETSS